MCFVTLVIQGGAMATFWPHFGHSTTINVWERIREKHLAQPCIPRGREGLPTQNFQQIYSWGCELSYETCPISLCALKTLLFKVVLLPHSDHIIILVHAISYVW